jgi:hypothetical protein
VFEVPGQAADDPAVAANQENPHGEDKAGTTEALALPKNDRTSQQNQTERSRVEQLQEEGVEERHLKKQKASNSKAEIRTTGLWDYRTMGLKR